MSTRWRYPLILLLSPTVAVAHGTEAGGMILGTLASAVITTIGLLVLPFRPHRRLAVFASYPLAVVSTCAGIAVLQDGINNTFGYSVWAWAVLSALLPLVLLGIVYYEFCRPSPPDTPQDSKEDP